MKRTPAQLQSRYAYKNVTRPASVLASDTVALAASTNDARPVFCHVHTGSGFKVGTDGFRLHAEKSRAKSCPICKREGYKFPDWQQLIPPTAKYTAVIDAQLLRAALVRSGIFAREASGTARVLASGHFEIEAEAERVGKSHEEIPVIQSDGQEMVFGINWQFAIDALDHCAPNGGPVEIRLNSANSIIAIRGKGRFALVMPMHI